MSHFVVMVVGDDIDYQLAPFHEFECTGVSDEFVVDVDVTQEAMAEYQKLTESRLRDPQGGLHHPYAAEFYRDPTPVEQEILDAPYEDPRQDTILSHSHRDWGDGRGYRAKIRFVPEGWEMVEVPTSEVEDFPTWVTGYYGGGGLVPAGEEPDLKGQHKYGYVRQLPDGTYQAIDRTNPNKRWDWYVVGGRWSNRLLLKNGQEADSALKGEIDWEAMRQDSYTQALADWDKVNQLRRGQIWETWETVLGRYRDADGKIVDMQAARDEYHNQPALVAMKTNAKTELPEKDDLWFNLTWEPDEYLVDRETYGQDKANERVAALAYLENREWIQNGTMGWFASSHGETMTEVEFRTKVWERIQALPDTARLTIVDCHI